MHFLFDSGILTLNHATDGLVKLCKNCTTGVDSAWWLMIYIYITACLLVTAYYFIPSRTKICLIKKSNLHRNIWNQTQGRNKNHIIHENCLADRSSAMCLKLSQVLHLCFQVTQTLCIWRQTTLLCLAEKFNSFTKWLPLQFSTLWSMTYSVHLCLLSHVWMNISVNLQSFTT